MIASLLMDKNWLKFFHIEETLLEEKEDVLEKTRYFEDVRLLDLGCKSIAFSTHIFHSSFVIVTFWILTPHTLVILDR
jgi:hypothetical protein